jgi:signal transduction histidine kinase
MKANHWELIEDAVRDAYTGNRMIKRILDSNKLDKIELRPKPGIQSFSDHSLFSDCQRMFQDPDKNRIVRRSKRVIFIRCDRDLLRLALFEIFDNALKYSKDEVTFVVYEEQTAVIIEIIDKGPGFSAEAKKRMFDKDWRDKNTPAISSKVGLGLGLYLAHEYIVKLLKGQLEPLDFEGGGAFRIGLPKEQ